MVKHFSSLSKFTKLGMYFVLATLLWFMTLLGLNKSEGAHSTLMPEMINTTFASHICSTVPGGDDDGGGDGGGDDSGDSGGGSGDSGGGPGCD